MQDLMSYADYERLLPGVFLDTMPLADHWAAANFSVGSPQGTATVSCQFFIMPASFYSADFAWLCVRTQNPEVFPTTDGRLLKYPTHTDCQTESF